MVMEDIVLTFTIFIIRVPTSFRIPFQEFNMLARGTSKTAIKRGLRHDPQILLARDFVIAQTFIILSESIDSGDKLPP